MVRGAGWVGGDVGREVRFGRVRDSSSMRSCEGMRVGAWEEPGYCWGMTMRGNVRGKETASGREQRERGLSMCERCVKSKGT